MKTSDFDYNLPEELIAQFPLKQRDESRLLVLHRCDGTREHKSFKNILEYLHPEDTLVINDTRVLPARLLGKKAGSGGKIEFLLLKRLSIDTWELILRPGKKVCGGVRRFPFPACAGLNRAADPPFSYIKKPPRR